MNEWSVPQNDGARLYTELVKDPCQLTPAEFELMEVLWGGKAALSVGQVLQVIRARKKVAYTTVMTLLDKMARKGSLQRIKQGKAYFYSPRVARSQVLDFLIRDFTASYGSPPRSSEPRPVPGAAFEDLDVSLL